MTDVYNAIKKYNELRDSKEKVEYHFGKETTIGLEGGEQTRYETFGDAIEGIVTTAGSMLAGAGSATAGLPGDIGALFVGIKDAVSAEDGKRIDAFVNSFTEFSKANLGSEYFKSIFDNYVDGLPISDTLKQDAKSGYSVGEFGGVGGTVTAGAKVGVKGFKKGLEKIGEKAQRELDLDTGGTTLSSMGGGEIDKAINKGLSKLAPNKVVKLDTQKNKKKAKPRDESSGHASDFVPAQFGPPAHKMNMEADGEFSPDGYGTFSADVGDNYQNLKFFIQSVRGSKQFDEEVAFYRKLFEIKDNPNAEITIYRASPTDDLRYGDLVTPIKSDADYYVEQSKITRDDIIKEERKMRTEGDKPVDLKQEKAFRAIDSIMELFPDNTTPSKVFTYKVKAKDIRWDGNNGLIRWGYFPEGKVETISKQGNASKISLDDIKNKYPNVDLDIYSTPKGLTLSKIAVPKESRSEGVGSNVMKDIINYADENNLSIALTPDNSFGGSKTRLKSFYKKFGFKENKGRNKDFTFRESMIRQPVKGVADES